MHRCAYMWRPEVDIECLISFLFSLHIGIDALAKPGASDLAYLVSQHAPDILCLLLLSVGITGGPF